MLGGATLVQGVVALGGYAAGRGGAAGLLVRGPGAEPAAAGPGLLLLPYILWMKTIVLPVFGMKEAERFMRAIVAVTRGNLASPATVPLALAMLALAVLAVGWLARGLPPRLRWWLTGGYIVIAVPSIALSFGNKLLLFRTAAGCSRYVFVPGVAFLFLLLHNVRSEADGWPSVRASTCATLLALGVSIGVVRYPVVLRWSSQVPDWRVQVREWRDNSDRRLALHPPGWYMQLPPRTTSLVDRPHRSD